MPVGGLNNHPGSVAKPYGGSRTVLHLLLILLVVAVSYFNALGNGFVTDDFGLVADNPNAKSWDRLGRIFTTGYWDAEGGTGGLYRPLTILSFLIEHTLAGKNPLLYHLDNVVLHLLCSVLVYLILKEISGAGRVPFFAALIFAAHPVHTEAVTWVSGRAELLSALFGLASVFAYLRWRDAIYGVPASAALFAVALLSKESGLVVPLMIASYILLYESPQPGETRPVQLARRLWPYIAVTAAFVPVRFAVLGRFGPVEHEQALFGVDPYDRFLTMCRALYEYMRLGFFPAELKAAYLFPPPSSLLDPRVLFSIALVLAMVSLARRIIGFSRPGYLAASWFLLALLPVSNIIPTGVIMSERAMYLPSLGACMLMASAFVFAGSLLKSRTETSFPFATVLLLPVLGLFMAGTISRNPVWKSQEVFGRNYMRMVQDYIRQYPDEKTLYRHLAAMRLRFFDYGPETEADIQEAYRRMPDDEEVHYLMAFSYLDRKMPEKALEEIRYVIDNFPPAASRYYFASGVLYQLKRYGEALAMLDVAIELSPNKLDYYKFKGSMLMELGRDNEALGVYERLTGLDPDDYDSFLRRGIILDSARKFGPAIEMVKRAVELRPDIADLHYFLAVAYIDAGLPGQAAPELDKALAIKPGYREAEELRERLNQPPARRMTPRG